MIYVMNRNSSTIMFKYISCPFEGHTSEISMCMCPLMSFFDAYNLQYIECILFNSGSCLALVG